MISHRATCQVSFLFPFSWETGQPVAARRHLDVDETGPAMELVFQGGRSALLKSRKVALLKKYQLLHHVEEMRGPPDMTSAKFDSPLVSIWN